MSKTPAKDGRIFCKCPCGWCGRRAPRRPRGLVDVFGPCRKCGQSLIKASVDSPRHPFYSRAGPQPSETKCVWCSAMFVPLRVQVRTGKGKYCSRKCFYASRRGGPLPETWSSPPHTFEQMKAAHRFVNNGITLGHFSRGSCCQKCGGDYKIEAHHEDYSAFNVIFWLCAKCHHQSHIHRGFLEGLSPFVLRDYRQTKPAELETVGGAHAL